MNTIAVLFVCVQACLVQSVFSQCLNPGRGYGIPPNFGGIAPPMTATAFAPANYGYPAGIADYGYGAGLGGIYPGALAGGYPAGYGLDSYGGAGEGNVAVAGELPVAGATAVAGQVPILGAVSFGGDVLAGGTVSISGNCACGCDYPYGF